MTPCMPRTRAARRARWRAARRPSLAPLSTHPPIRTSERDPAEGRCICHGCSRHSSLLLLREGQRLRAAAAGKKFLGCKGVRILVDGWLLRTPLAQGSARGVNCPWEARTAAGLDDPVFESTTAFERGCKLCSRMVDLKSEKARWRMHFSGDVRPKYNVLPVRRLVLCPTCFAPTCASKGYYASSDA